MSSSPVEKMSVRFPKVLENPADNRKDLQESPKHCEFIPDCNQIKISDRCRLWRESGAEMRRQSKRNASEMQKWDMRSGARHHLCGSALWCEIALLSSGSPPLQSVHTLSCLMRNSGAPLGFRSFCPSLALIPFPSSASASPQLLWRRL